MKLSKYLLGDLIQQRREKNSFEGLPICGVTRDGFIPPKQQDADTSLYNVFYKGDFVFNPARMELNSIVFNDIYDKAICSSLYEVFYVKRTDIVVPEFLALLVKQNWFTRYCEFLGSGSAREYCRVANISEIEIELPPIENQIEISHQHKILVERIALKKHINDNLVELCKTEFMRTFATHPEYRDEQSDWFSHPLGKSLSRVAMGPFGSNIKTDCFVDHGVPVLNGDNISGYLLSERSFRYVEEEKASQLKNSIAVSGDIVITHRGTLGQIALVPDKTKFDRYVISQSQFLLTCDQCTLLPEYVLFYFHTDAGRRKLLANDNTTGVPSIAKPTSYIKALHIPIPPIELQQNWAVLVRATLAAVADNNLEMEKLTGFAQTLLSGLSR